MTQLQNLVASIVTRLQREEGQTMAEYGMLVALIAVAAIIGVTAFGGALGNFFTGLPAQLKI